MTTSAAICTYNGQTYLQVQLESIAHQTTKVDEIVICDDKSGDDTHRIIERFKSLHPEIRVRFIKNPENLGYQKNFEQAMSLCSGDIIFLSDQDDVWMPEKVETFCKYFEEHPEIDFAFSNAKLINANGTENYSQTLFDVVGLNRRNKWLFSHGHAQEILSTGGRVTGCASAVRASFLPYCIPFLARNTKPIHDESMTVAAASYGKIGFIDRCLIKYRQHDSQTVGISLLFK